MKRTISIIMIMAMVIGITVPMAPGFAAEDVDASGYYSPEQLPIALGVSKDAMKELEVVIKDYLSWKGDTESEGVEKFWNEVLTDQVKTDLRANDVNGDTLRSAFNTLYGEVTLDQTVEEIFTGLEDLASDFGTIYDNINSDYVIDGITASDSKVATYLYYAVSAMQDEKILQPEGDTIKFIFDETSNGLTDTMMSKDDEYSIKEYIELAMNGNLTFDLENLETKFNTELQAFIDSGNVTADDIETLATEFGVLLAEETSDTSGGSTSGGSSSGGSSGGTTTTTPSEDSALDDEKFTNESEAANKVMNNANATAKEVSAAVQKVTEAASRLIGGEDVDGEEAAAIVKKVVEETIAKAMANEKTTKKEKDQLKKTAGKLAEKAARKAGNVNVTAKTEITKALVEEAIKKAKTAIESLEEILSGSGLTNANRPMKATVTLESEDDDSEISLSADVIASLKGQKANLAIGTKGSSLLVPSETLDTVAEDETIEITSNAISEGLNAGLNNQAGQQYNFIKTRDIVVSKKKADGTSEQLTRLSLTFDLSDYEGDTDQIAVLVRNNATGQFELLKSWVVDGELQFKSPHYSYYTLAEYTPDFDDVSNHWAQGVINKMAAKGIVKGKTDDMFDPQGAITRAEFITMLMNAFDYESTIVTSFDDTDADAWYYGSINSGKALGLVNGVGENQFNPNASITRQDMVVMMARFFEAETDERLVALEDTFEDSSKASGYARYYINGAAEVDIVNGTGEGFNPLNNATRAEALKMIDNLLIYLK